MPRGRDRFSLGDKLYVGGAALLLIERHRGHYVLASVAQSVAGYPLTVSLTRRELMASIASGELVRAPR